MIALFRVGTVVAVFAGLICGFFRGKLVAVAVAAHVSHGIRDLGAARVELGSDLEAVEQEPGTLGIDALVHDGVEDFMKSDLQFATVFEGRQRDGVKGTLGAVARRRLTWW